MKFGIGPFNMQIHPENPSSHSEIYRQALGQVKLAEEVNFDSVWIPEHHFLENGHCPSPIVIASAMASVTKRIKIGSAVVALPLHNPLKVAEDAAVVERISAIIPDPSRPHGKQPHLTRAEAAAQSQP